ncbi:MAG: polymer-forming cytoskeletal protein [Candidatus Omnitrophota bacterium]
MAMRDRKKESEERVITVDSAMQGSLSFKEPVHLRINGKFEGTLEARGILEIGENALVDATISGDEVVISGRVKGEIAASKRLVLKERAVVEGNIKTPTLQISEGAVFQGRCAMLGDIFDSEGLARYLEVDLHTIVEWANSGKIPAFKEANDWKFERKKIDEWVSAGKIG